MNPPLVRFLILAALTLSSMACAPRQQFYWGSYEDSLFSRQQHAGAEGEASALTMLASTITDAPSDAAQKVGPGIHADYGYLLLKQGRPDEAIAELQKEASLYPESAQLMNTMISRIQERKKKDAERKPAP